MSMGGAADGMSAHMFCITPAPQIEEHRCLLLDSHSQNAFKKAIFNTVQPGDVVLDLGTGSGIHAFFACQAGAKKVYAVDSESILEIARETAVLNGFNNKIEFILANAQDMKLPEKVDVIITNIGFLNTLQTLPDIVRRHLKPGGKTIPSSLELQFSLVHAPHEFNSQIQFWKTEKYGLNFSAFRKMASNHPLYTLFKQEQLLAKPASLGKLDMLSKNIEYHESEITFKVKKASTAHGLGGWYRFWYGDQILMSTEPPLKLAKEIWSEIFLPFEKPINLNKNEIIKFQIGMYTRGSYSGPLWRWRGYRENNLVVDQCSFKAIPLGHQFLEKISAH